MTDIPFLERAPTRVDAVDDRGDRRLGRAMPAHEREQGLFQAADIREHAPQRQALLRLVAAALDGVPRPEPWHDDHLDWEALIATAAAGRLLTHVYHGAVVCGIDIPQSLREAGRAFRARALLVNSVNLSTIQRVGAALDRNGPPFVVIKGPLQLQRLYGEYFVRPSSDIDLLVDRRDYDRAAEVLVTLGYRPAERCETRWWRHYLGEQHFLAADKALATVDLHHRVQQPGCPAPRELVSYIRTASRVALGHAEVPVLSGVHACLLTAISFVKAVYHREHSLRYLCDLAVMLRRMSDLDRDNLARTAEMQGMRNLLIFAWQCAADLLPMKLPPVPVRSGSPLIGPEKLAAIVLTPDDVAIAWPKRRQLLWHLCDSSGVLGRAGNYVREAFFAAAAELSHRRTGRPV